MDTDAILTLLKETAAELITPRFRALSEEEVMEKAPGDLVTVADREAEVAITARLREAYPDALILGEEATETDSGCSQPSPRPNTPSPSIRWTARRTSCQSRRFMR